MKYFILITLTLICLNCSNNPNEQLQHLNGYWEIKEATSNGITKTYTISEYIDYIAINDSLKGFKKKVKPTFKETFIATNIKEKLEVVIKDNTIYLHYTTPFLERVETVLKLTKQELKVKNEDNAVYVYNRYEPIQL